MRVLFVEDNKAIAESVMYAFKEKGYIVTWTSDVRETGALIASGLCVDIVILDVGLPDGNGFDLYRDIISKKGFPTIFLTAKDNEDDIVKGLTLGAEDYIKKPFSIKELIARIDKVLMRNKAQTMLWSGDICFDMDKMQAVKNGEVIALSGLEIKLLALLFENAGKALSRNFILDKIWEWTGNDVDDHTVTVYIKRIREKLGSDIICTIKGIGYRIDKNGE